MLILPNQLIDAMRNSMDIQGFPKVLVATDSSVATSSVFLECMRQGETSLDAIA